MYQSERILKAIGNIDEELLERVNIKQKSRNEGVIQAKRGRSMGSLVLIAAILTVLFTVTAYATGGFGLAARVTPGTAPRARQTETHAGTEEASGGYLSYNGYADSAEGKAYAEWFGFLLNYDCPLSSEESRAWDKAHAGDPAIFYGVRDDRSLTKLGEIIEKYALKLHTAAVTPQTEELFYRLTGLEPFVEGSEHLSVLYVYEDGSFSAETESAGGLLRLDRGAKGVLCPSGIYLWDSESCEEWQVTSAEGIVIHVAQNETLNEWGEYQGWFFAEAGEFFMTGAYRVPQGETLHGPAEDLLEGISFAKLGQGNTKLDIVVDASPSEAEAKEGLLTVETLMSRPEYLASVGFQRAYNDWYDENGRIAVNNRSNGYVSGQYDKGYYGNFPCGKGDLDETLQALAKEYGLEAPKATKAIREDSWVDPKSMLETMWFEDHVESIGPAAANDGWAMIGCEPFLNYDPLTFVLWDNGAWKIDTISYVPYGCINPVLRAIQDPLARSWAYDTACGAQVLICESGTPREPELTEAHILYDTGTGFVVVVGGGAGDEVTALEHTADSIDFTKIP